MKWGEKTTLGKSNAVSKQIIYFPSLGKRVGCVCEVDSEVCSGADGRD